MLLDGVKVLDCSEGIAGSLACQMLGDMNAEIIKLERPQGDWARTMGPGEKEGSTHYYALNRNKRNICVDVKKAQGLGIANELLKSADVIISNYRPGVMDKLGLGFEETRKINPDIIYGRVSAYGFEDPLAKLPGSDTILQAVSGIMNQIGDPNGEPYRAGLQIVDHTAARDLTIGVLAALVARGKGKRLESPIDVSLLATSAALQAQQWQEFLISKQVPKRMGNKNAVLAPAGLYETKGGSFITLAILREEHWEKFCRALDIGYLLEDEDLKTNMDRMNHRERIDEKIIPIFKKESQEYWVDFLGEKDILVAPVNDLGQVYEDEDLMTGIPFIELPSNYFSTKYDNYNKKSVGLPIGFGKGIDTEVKYGPPAKGEHTKEILLELGYEDKEIVALRKAEVVYDMEVSVR